jgi:hypothetical protein
LVIGQVYSRHTTSVPVTAQMSTEPTFGQP